jgi:flavin reductase (DIM6/NTAB) family NADH-FMN oxidoreductase RutF
MKHFLKRFPPGSDRFAGVKTYPATDGSPILADALAYMECEVKSRMDCGDHWTIYATVSVGRVSKPDALTAVHHRKVGIIINSPFQPSSLAGFCRGTICPSVSI